MADLIPLSAVQPAPPNGAAPISPPSSDWVPDQTRQTGTRETGFSTEVAPSPGAFGYTNTKTGEWSAQPPPAQSAPALIPLNQVQVSPPAAPPSAAPESTFQYTDLEPLNGPANALQGFTDQAKRALSFGLSDKVNAAVPALNNAAKVGWNWLTGTSGQNPSDLVTGKQPPSTSDIYHGALEKERAAGEAYAANHPIASKVATTLGTVASIPLMAPAGGGAAAPTLLGRIGQGAKIGAGVGTVAGFGGSNDQSLAQTATDTAEGAGLGALTGGASPVIAEHVVAPLWNWVSRQFSPAAAGNQAVTRIMQRIGQDAEGGGPSAQDMLDLMNAGLPNKPITLADIGGNNVLGEAGRVARAPGPGKQAAIDALNSRDVGAGTRLAQDINADIANGGPTFTTAQALDQARSARAAPLYQDAFAANKNVASPKLDRILQTDAGQAALAGARERMSNKMALMGVPDTDLMEQAREAGQYIPGGKGVASGMKLQTWDLIKQQLDDMIGAKKQAVISGSARRGEVADLVSLKNGLVSELDRLDSTVPKPRGFGKQYRTPQPGKYEQARAAYSGPSQSMDALKEGGALFSKEPDEIAHEFAQLTPSDREFYKLGAANALKTAIRKTGSGGDEAKRIMGNEQIQQQLRPLFSNQASYDKFIAAAKMENRMFETRLQTIGNSASAGRIAEDDASRAHGGALGGALEAGTGLLMGEHVAPIAGGMRVLKSLASNRPPQDPAVNAEISRMLFSTDPQANRELLARIIARQNAPSMLPTATVPLASLAARGVPPLLRGYQGQ